MNYWLLKSEPKTYSIEMLQSEGQTIWDGVRNYQARNFLKEMQHRDILSLDPQGKYHHKVKLMCDFATQHQLTEVPDPYYGGKKGFDLVIDLLLDSCQGLLKELSP